MADPVEVITNGSFEVAGLNLDGSPIGWEGTAVEANYTEQEYFYDVNGNKVVELERDSETVTVLKQTVTIDEPVSTNLTFITALRPANTVEGEDGFRVEILNSAGQVIATRDIFPLTVHSGADPAYPAENDWQPVSIPVTFETAGEYTIVFTELGGSDAELNNGYGAVIDNVSLLVCFGGHTRIDTPDGGKLATDIVAGDLVTTERGPMPVRWVGRRRVSAEEMAANDKFRPVKITAGALGQGLPVKDLWVSRQHRMLVSSPVCQRMFGQTDILVSALKLTALPGIFIDETVTEIEYIHLLFDRHEVVFAESAPSESMLLGQEAIVAMSEEALEEIALIFPEMTVEANTKPIPKGKLQSRLAERMMRNDRQPLEAFHRT